VQQAIVSRSAKSVIDHFVHFPLKLYYKE